MSTPKKKKKKAPAPKDSLYELAAKIMRGEPNPIDCCWIARVFRKYPAPKDAGEQRQAMISIDEALAARLEKVVTRRFLHRRAMEGCSDERLLILLEGIPEVSPSQGAAETFAKIRELVVYSIGEIRCRGYYLLHSIIHDPLEVRF